MTITKTWLNMSLLLIITSALVSGCGGKKAKSEEAADSTAPVEDITTPPQIIQPKDSAEEKDDD